MRSMFAATLAAILLLAGLSSTSPTAAAQPAGRNAPVAVGETAPDFTLADHNGGKFTLSTASKSQPVVLVFYRGHW